MLMFRPSTTFLLALSFALPTLAQNDNNFPPLGSSTSPSATTGKSSSQASRTASASGSGTNSAAAASTTSAATLPPLSSATASQSYDGIQSAPQLSGHYSYPAASVPPTANAPFMQKSTLPQGTVFICVGAALGFLFFLVLAWRSLVAYSIHRSIKKAKNPYPKLPKKFKGLASDGKGMLAKASAPFYSSGPGSTLSLDPLNSSGKGAYKPVHNTGSLFFSPTVGTGKHSSTPNNRSSGYLPAGYYAAGASEAGSGRPISMTDFTVSRPQSQGYQRAYSAGPSPMPSPMLDPTTNPLEGLYGRGGAAAGQSTASLGAKSEGRAPSAYLEDLFDYQPLPEKGEGERKF